MQGIYNPVAKRNLRYDETLIVPIIENTPFEEDLKDRMAQVMEEYPETSAILVRRHGIYVWGETWEKTKAMQVFFTLKHKLVDTYLILYNFDILQDGMLRLLV